jgi:uroporphyrinogen decarboxylase
MLYLYDTWENLWRKIGVEQALLAMATEPQWVHEMAEAHTRLNVETIELLWSEGVRPDGAMLVSDFASYHGLLFSPAMYREYVFPYHRQMCDFLASLGLPVIFHSCGRITDLIPDLIEAGIRALHSLSCRSGLELRKVKEEFGEKLVLIGNVDVLAMAEGGDRLEREVREKILCGKDGGGYVYHSDHTIPPTVSFKNYQRVVEMVRDLGQYD